jgi:MFS family permease
VALVGLLYAGKAHNEIAFLAFAFLVGFGGGAFYPMFASMAPDYFGENNNASNYGLIYSSKLLGSVVGIGVGASVIEAWGYTGAYWIAAVSALVSAGVAFFLRQPGRQTTAKPRVGALSEPSMADLKAD